ncbi:hypothetical protein KPL78_04030 [Roseomonas sp. HJA6]|uniref:Uncharacterized protein n=1 Tax=Roseomonas alba TaxID=2846776 RepID=A0ABS7A3Y1_9PROT|nr:hypothetical protein [Neoroseomonas alba]
MKWKDGKKFQLIRENIRLAIHVACVATRCRATMDRGTALTMLRSAPDALTAIGAGDTL